MANRGDRRESGEAIPSSPQERSTWAFRGADDDDQAFEFDFKTEIAPSFPGVFHSESPSPDGQLSSPPELNNAAGDFEIIRELGRGASGVVYLARERSLQREVALKVTHNIGSESRTMASLDHRNIVKVFSETVSHDGKLRMICMQYIPGETLDRTIERWRKEINREKSATSSDHHRCLTLAFVRRVVRIALPIAQALAHAHQRGILHRDIKPANILIDEEGQPYLSDFSLSIQLTDERVAKFAVFGGTVAYMSPEHLDALCSKAADDRERVDARSDIYSLGLVIHEMLTLAEPIAPESTQSSPQDYFQLMSELRRELPALVSHNECDVSNALNWLLEECLDPQPDDRFQTAEELTASLEGMQQYTTALTVMRPATRWTHWCRSHPVLLPAVFGLFANLLAIFIGVAYLSSQPHFSSDPAQFTFPFIVGCGLLAIPATATNLGFVLSRLKRWQSALRDNASIVQDEQVVRRQVSRFARQIVWVEIATWAPNYLIMPIAVTMFGGQLYWALIVEFLFGQSFFMLIVASSIYFLAEYFAMRIYYPYLWCDTRELKRQARDELKRLRQRVKVFHWLVGGLPVLVLVALLFIGPAHFAGTSYFTFRVMSIVLVVAGFFTLLAAGAIRRNIERVLDAFTVSAET